ncbi:MAG TPA: nucleotidyl transferase AbiEii/AbiGii toxin family protein [Terriglobia bacterium]|nr:nucleotidyl transferase AbiEii/AbiGii toxin family protein [Terriglobia bacterium]
MLKLLDLSANIDQSTLEFYEALGGAAASMGVPFFLVGATARDTIMEKGFSIRSGRATKDVDVAVRVSGWNEFDQLKQALLDSKQFAEARETQRLIYRNELPVDIIPFGGTADPDRKLSWPPDHDFIMSTLGFEEAYQAAQLVRVRARPPLDIRVASPAGLAILKIVAWADRPSERDKDAYDLAFIMENYLDAGNYGRLMEEHHDLMGVEDFDYTQAGCRLLGRDIGSIAKPETRARIQQTLQAETAGTGQYRLVRQMAKHFESFGEDERRIDHILVFLKELIRGIKETPL